MDRVVQYLKDFEAAAEQLREARSDVLPFINVNEVFDALSDNSGRYIPLRNFELFVDADCGTLELFDEFCMKGDPGITLEAFRNLLGFTENARIVSRIKHIDFTDSLDICRAFLLSYCTLFYETEKTRRSILRSKHFVATNMFRHLRHSSLIPSSLTYSTFTSAIAGLTHIS